MTIFGDLSLSLMNPLGKGTPTLLFCPLIFNGVVNIDTVYKLNIRGWDNFLKYSYKDCFIYLFYFNLL